MAADPQRVRRTTDGAIVCDRLSMGESFMERFMGLMGRSTLPQGDGLYLKTSSIHMMFMRFPIDALFVGKPGHDGTRRVVAVREQLPPWRGLVLPVRGADAVIELPAGTLDRHSVTANDVVVFETSGAG
jgi:uncharacterized membrane protein (UPF0127 family)